MSGEADGNLAFGENLLALRLENVSLREPLSDLRAGNANLLFARGVRKELGENLPVPQPTERAPSRLAWCSFCCVKATKKIFFVGCNKDLNPSKINTFRPSGEKLH